MGTSSGSAGLMLYLLGHSMPRFGRLALLLLFGQWRPLGGEVWSVESPAGRFVLRGLFAFGWGLVLVAIRFEERDLVRDRGTAYEEYRRSVPMLMPFARRRAELAKRLGVAGVVFFVVKGLFWLALPAVVYLGR